MIMTKLVKKFAQNKVNNLTVNSIFESLPRTMFKGLSFKQGSRIFLCQLLTCESILVTPVMSLFL